MTNDDLMKIVDHYMIRICDIHMFESCTGCCDYVACDMGIIAADMILRGAY